MKRKKHFGLTSQTLLLCIMLVALPGLWHTNCGIAEEALYPRVDFSNGNIGFLMLYAIPVDSSPNTTMELVDYNGKNAVKITPDGSAAPYVVIDASSLLKERVVDLLTMEVMIATDHSSGTFYAVSGEIEVYNGDERQEVNNPWAVYLDRKNPNAARIFLDTDEKRFSQNEYNYFILSKKDDNALSAGKEPVSLYLLSISFYDSNGELLSIDPNAVFNAPKGFGEKADSILFSLMNETVIEGAYGSSAGGWGQAVSLETTKNGGIINPEWFIPGTIINVLYESNTLPTLILQSWTAGSINGWAQVMPRIYQNGTAQFFYDDMVAVFGTDDLITFFDKLYVGDTGEPLTVVKVSFGLGIQPPFSVKDEIIIEGASGFSYGGWGQAVSIETIRNGGTIDPSWLKPGTAFNIWFESDSTPEIILQSWTEGHKVGWAKVNPTALGHGLAQFTYEDLVEAFGTDDFEGLFDKFYVGDTGEAIEVYKVSIATLLPRLLTIKNEFDIENANGSSIGGWGQAVYMETTRNGGSIDPDWFIPGAVVTVTYESESPPEIIFQSWTDGCPVGWAKIQPFATEHGIAQFIYDDIATSFGTVDFVSYFDKFYIGDTGEALTVYKVTIGYTE